jgi:hypothetical protein
VAQGNIHGLGTGNPQIGTHFIQAFNHGSLDFYFKPLQALSLVTLAVLTFLNTTLHPAIIGITARPPTPGRREHINSCAIFGMNRHKNTSKQTARLCRLAGHLQSRQPGESLNYLPRWHPGNTV